MRLLLVAVVLVLAACASLPERAPVENPAAVWRARQKQLTRVDGWDLRGRLALRTDNEGASASLRWVRNGQRHQLNLAGPFGGGRVRLTYDDHRAELRDADGGVYRGTSMQELLLRATGWLLPIEGMNYWVLGLPDPLVPAQSTLDRWGRLKSLQQLGWNIDFLDYTQAGAFELPKRVFIKHESAGVSDAEIEARLVVENWSVRDGDAKGLAQNQVIAPATPKSSP